MLYAARLGSNVLAQILLSPLVATGIVAFDCGIEPIQLGIKNTPLDNGVPVNRGVQVKLPGNQILGLRISTVWNNTFISNANNCRRSNSSYNNACHGAVGSTFDPVENEGWEPFLTSDWEELVAHADEPPDGANVVRGVAETDLDDGPTIDLPIAVWSNPSIDPVNEKMPSPSRSVFGIGPSSDLLRSLLNGSFVPSSFMGLYFGSRSLNCSEDGELTIGGWSSLRVREPFINYSMNAVPMNATCPLQVRVTGMRLNTLDQGSHELFQGAEAVPACVDPFQNAIGLTDALYETWARATQHPTDFANQIYPLENEHLMETLEIELEGGYRTTIPHCELVSLQRGADINGIGDYTVTNRSRIMASVSSGANDLGTNWGVLLGGAFLATTYLRIDYEEGVFGLAPADGILGHSQQSSIHKVCSKDTSIPAKANSTISDASTTAALDADSDLSKNSDGGGLSTDAKATIGGSVAGGVIALIGVVIAYMAYKHAKRAEHARRQSEAQKMELEMERSRTMSTYVGMSPPVGLGLSPGSKPAERLSPEIGSTSQHKETPAGMELPKPALGQV